MEIGFYGHPRVTKLVCIGSPFLCNWCLYNGSSNHLLSSVINDHHHDHCGKRAATWTVSGANMQSDKSEVALSGGLTRMMILSWLTQIWEDFDFLRLGYEDICSQEKSCQKRKDNARLRWDLGPIKRRWLTTICFERFGHSRSVLAHCCTIFLGHLGIEI